MTMCGISAIISKSSGGEDLQDELKDLLEKISHRGDSKKEYAIFGDHGLGCVRLKIVDQDYSVQPILNENGTIAVVFNGEIYNYLVLKKDLEEKGHKFKTGGDTEVIVHLFEEYGKEMIFRLEGMFAFIILDIQNNKFFAARDFFGVKPLHYCQSPEKTYFSSELKSFLQLPVEEYFEIPPGHFLTDEGLVKYYDLKVLPLHEQPFDTLKQEVRRLLDKAIEKRVQTELPIGVFLSGGVDSSITLLRALIFNKNIVAIIIGTEESEDVTNGIKLCEENNIQYVHINIPHQTLVGKIEEIIGIVESFETVVVRASCYSFFLSKVAQEKGIKVVLCGEGADEVFGGYGDFLEPNNDRDFQELTLEFISGLARSQLLRIDKCLMLRQFLQTIAE